MKTFNTSEHCELQALGVQNGTYVWRKQIPNKNRIKSGLDFFSQRNPVFNIHYLFEVKILFVSNEHEPPFTLAVKSWILVPNFGFINFNEVLFRHSSRDG